MPIKIDRNVPAPATSARGEYGKLVYSMQVGDSVYAVEKKIMQNVRAAIDRHGFKSLSRREGKGWRIWKIERTQEKF